MDREEATRYLHKLNAERQLFGDLLMMIEMFDGKKEYATRNRMIYHALAVATNMGLEAGIRLDPAKPGWPLIFIELPTGQISWHVPAHASAWDGHKNEEKYVRIHNYLDQFLSRSARSGSDRPGGLPGDPHPGAQSPASR